MLICFDYYHALTSHVRQATTLDKAFLTPVKTELHLLSILMRSSSPSSSQSSLSVISIWGRVGLETSKSLPRQDCAYCGIESGMSEPWVRQRPKGSVITAKPATALQAVYNPDWSNADKYLCLKVSLVNSLVRVS